ncbi:YajQ family cyclic di-GMP-binding protein [Candidatus Gracilibacteria bacterium]|nr:YajQ family cyclic di-GMP-binding protein [Candidatus Gracilibacteria bacterium]
MASDHSMDISVDFDFQELKNAVDQALREATNRFDLKDSGIEIALTEDMVKITAAADIQIESVFAILIKKMIGRNLSSKIFKRGEVKEIGGMRARQEIEIIKSLNQENAKKISAYIRENFPKAKPNIQGDTVRVSSKSIDDLQAIQTGLNTSEAIAVPLSFGNFK